MQKIELMHVTLILCLHIQSVISLGLEFNFHAKITIMMTEEAIVASDKERTTYITGFISDGALRDDNDRSAVVDGDIDIDDKPDTN